MRSFRDSFDFGRRSAANAARLMTKVKMAEKTVKQTRAIILKQLLSHKKGFGDCSELCFEVILRFENRINNG